MSGIIVIYIKFRDFFYCDIWLGICFVRNMFIRWLIVLLVFLLSFIRGDEYIWVKNR